MHQMGALCAPSFAGVLLALLFTCNSLVAQQSQPSADASTESLQKATQNPVSSLISVPIQNNSNFNVGPYDRVQDVLNIQPVIPAKLNDR